MLHQATSTPPCRPPWLALETRLALVLLALLGATLALNMPQDLCVERPILTPGDFYYIETNVSEYRWSTQVEVTIKPRNPIGPPISEVFLYVPETDPRSPNFRLEMSMVGSWKPKSNTKGLLCMNGGMSGFSFFHVLAGNKGVALKPDAIQSANPLELKMNVTALWVPPRGAYDYSQRTGIQFMAYVSPDPNHKMRRWYRAASRVVRNRDQFDLAMRQKILEQWWASTMRRFETLSA